MDSQVDAIDQIELGRIKADPKVSILLERISKRFPSILISLATSYFTSRETGAPENLTSQLPAHQTNRILRSNMGSLNNFIEELHATRENSNYQKRVGDRITGRKLTVHCNFQLYYS